MKHYIYFLVAWTPAQREKGPVHVITVMSYEEPASCGKIEGYETWLFTACVLWCLHLPDSNAVTQSNYCFRAYEKTHIQTQTQTQTLLLLLYYYYYYYYYYYDYYYDYYYYHYNNKH